MFQNIEELKNEIDTFRDNMNRSNGSIALISEAIEKMNTNIYTLKHMSEQFDLTREQLEAEMAAFEKNQESNQAATMSFIKELSSKNESNQAATMSSIKELSSKNEADTERIVEKLDKLQKQMLEQFKTDKILSGVIIGLLTLSIALNIIC